MVKRRNTYTYIEFLRGMYDILNVDYLQKMFTKMSIEEKKNILESNFKTLWNELWLIENNLKNKNEFYKGIIKFNILKNGYYNDGKVKISLKYLIDNSKKNYIMEEWYFPKGKKEFLINNPETDIETSLREFCEETNIEKDQYDLYNNIIPLIEEYTGINGVRYKHVYYIGEIKNYCELSINMENKDQYTEVKNIEWLSEEECYERIRDYDLKKRILKSKFTSIIVQYH